MFPEMVTSLPEADILLSGLTAHLMQAEGHQVLFMEFKEDAVLPEHSHKSQYGIVLDGKIDLTIDGVTHTYTKGDTYYIPEGVKHSVKAYAGYTDITFFGQEDRYPAKS